MLSIRKANIDDAAQIGKVHVDSWRTGYKSFMPKDVLNNLSYDEKISFWQSMFNTDSSYKRVYCAVHDSKIIGFSHFDLSHKKHPEYKGQLIDIHVLPEYRGEGIGNNLFCKGIDYFIEKKVIA